MLGAQIGEWGLAWGVLGAQIREWGKNRGNEEVVLGARLESGVRIGAPRWRC